LADVFESIGLRDEAVPDLLVVVRLGSNTLLDQHLAKSTAECHAQWGIWVSRSWRCQGPIDNPAWAGKPPPVRWRHG
jgi:hypothetical protein